MKHRPDLMESYAQEVTHFIEVLDSKDNKTADDAYKQIAAKGFYIIGFFLDRINDKLAFMIGILIAAVLFFD